jgi:hypothetical protein
MLAAPREWQCHIPSIVPEKTWFGYYQEKWFVRGASVYLSSHQDCHVMKPLARMLSQTFYDLCLNSWNPTAVVQDVPVMPLLFLLQSVG